jgi:hypothetical protein
VTSCDNPPMHHPIPTRTRRGPIVLPVLLCVVALAATACGQSTATPSASAAPSPAASSAPSASAAPSGSAQPSAAIDENAIFDEIEAQVVAIRGLQPTAKVAREIIDEARLREIFTEQFDEESPPAYVAANERMYKALGLLPEDADLKQMQLDMLSAGVAGFYRDDEKKMYVVSRSGSLSAEDKVTYAHEYTHALQDQHYTVFKDQKKVLDRSDWILARQAVYEGDASVAMSYWLAGNLTPEELATILQGGSGAEQQAVLDSMPAILRETLLYPYTTGAFYVQAAQASGGWPAVDDFYARMPESTEQILHPEAYAAKEAPVKVTVPKDLAKDLGSGWSVALEDTFGEFQMGIWLREGGSPTAAANTAAAGWGGDRLAVIDGPDGAWALAMRTAWDTADDATEFDAAATTAMAKAGGPGQVLPGAGGTERWVLVADGAKTLGTVAGALGLAG